MVIGKYLIKPVRELYPTPLTSFTWGHMVGVEQDFVLEGGGPIPRNGNKGKKLHV
jgi:hypothetical protein